MEGKPDWLPDFPVQIYCNRYDLFMKKFLRRIVCGMLCLACMIPFYSTAFAAETPHYSSNQLARIESDRELLDTHKSYIQVKNDMTLLGPGAKLLNIETYDLGNDWTVEHAFYENTPSVFEANNEYKVIGGTSVDTWKRGNTVVFKIYITGFFEYNGNEVHILRDRCELWYISYVYDEDEFEMTTMPEFIELDPENQVHYGCGYTIDINNSMLGYGYKQVSCHADGELDIYNSTYECLF